MTISPNAPGPSARPVDRPTVGNWVAGARPRTLPSAVVPVMVGTAVAIGTDGATVTWWRVAVALGVSLLLQIGVNYANDYSDGIRGTDDVRVGPMRLVASGVARPGAVKRAAFLAMGLAAVLGLALAATTSWWLLAVGAAAIGAAWFYTGGPKPYGYLGLGEVFVFTFFGLVATVGTTYVACQQVPGVTWIVACGLGFLTTAVLVVNNLRDIPTDREAGKKTLAVRLGDANTRRFYALLVGAAFPAAILAAAVRPWSLLALGALVLARGPIQTVIKGAKGRDLIPVLGATGKAQLLYAALLAVGLAVG